jgi:hypothetical protein
VLCPSRARSIGADGRSRRAPQSEFVKPIFALSRYLISATKTRRLCALTLAIALPFAAAGCGDTVIDSSKTEDTIQASLEKSLGGEIKAVNCPTDQKVEVDTTFDCTVVFPDGDKETVTLKIRNSDADLSIVGLGNQR